MLSELRVRQLGVIEDQSLVLGAGMTVLTGETGAGKTLIVDAIELLLGGRVDPVLVRSGATEAIVEARFVGAPVDEVVLGRVVPAAGRARAYLDGRMVASGALAAAGGALVDLHGQHSHQSLLSPATQRAALDAAAGIDLRPLDDARGVLRRVGDAQAAIGGDQRARAREADLLRFQLDELDGAGLDDPCEDAVLRTEEDRLAGASAHRAALEEVVEAVNGDGGAADRLGAALSALAGRVPLRDLHARLHGVVTELADVAADARSEAEGFEDDPGRLVEIGDRRHVLAELRRKYGDTLTEVIAYRDEGRRRLDELESHDARAAALAAERVTAEATVAAALAVVGAARRRAAGPFAREVEKRLRTLALPAARFEVRVGDDPGGETVTWMLAANPGLPALALSKVASGGELARTMLAARLVLSAPDTDAGAPAPDSDAGAPAPDSDAAVRRTLVFDEVDAGIGGAAAVAVGRALAALGRHHQVLVVTHLPQVAAFADRQIVVTKTVVDGRTSARVEAVDGAERVVELSRMLSGRPDSETGRRHAAELLDMADGSRPPVRPVDTIRSPARAAG